MSFRMYQRLTSFVRQNCARTETEMDLATKLSAELVARGVDVWKEEDGAVAQNEARCLEF
jgi:hypothetical protein